MLENSYEIEFKKIPFIDRKLKVISKKSLIVGVKYSGKSFLIYDYLSKMDKSSYIYIDLMDSSNDIDLLNEKLNNFCQEKSIKTVAIDNYDKRLNLPKVENVIITSCSNIEISGYTKYTLYNLDFEEFLAFDKSVDINQSYNNFLQNGGIGDIISLHQVVKHKRLKEIVELICDNITKKEILKIIALFVTQELSVYRLFITLKKQIKISKDTTYRHIKELEDNFIIHKIEKLNQPKSAKKYYLFDFAIITAITDKKDFFKIFENATYLELLKKEYKVFYTNEFTFYIPDEKKALLCIPFCDLNSTRLQKKSLIDECIKLDVSKIEIITVQSEFLIQVDNILIEAIPFYIWAVGL